MSTRRIITDYLLAATRATSTTWNQVKSFSATLTSTARDTADGALGYLAKSDAEVTASCA